MTFAAPGLLYALPLSAVPLLLHLFSLRRAKTVKFGDLALLREVHARAMPRTRLRSWLLAAARCLLLLFLILAYAGPILPSASAGAPGGGVEEGVDLVLLLDSSYSMGLRTGGKTRFDLARAAGEELLKGLAPADRAAVGVFSQTLETPPQWAPRSRALDTLSRAKLGSRGTDFAPPLKAGYDLLSASRRRKVVVLLSDGALHGVKAPLTLDPAVSTLILTWPDAGVNSLISSVSLAAETSSSRPRLIAAAKAYGSRDALSTYLELSIDGLKTAGQALTLPPGRDASAGVLLPSPKNPAEPAWAGKVALRADLLSADDDFFFSFRRALRPRALCLYGHPDFFKSLNGGYFLKEILGGAGDSLLEHDADFMELSRIGEARLSDYTAVVLADFKEVPAAAAGSLDQFVRRGGGLWILPGGRTEVSGFKAIDEWLPAHVGPAAFSSDPGGLRPAAPAAWKEFDLGRVAVGRYHKLEPRPGARVLLSSASGDPLLVVGSRGEGRVAVWASALDTTWSNIGVKPVFAALVSLALREVSPPAGAPAETLGVRIGEPIVRTWGSKEAAPARVRVRAPDGHAASLWVKDRRVEHRDTLVPGLYTIVDEGGAGGRSTYAVNLDRSSESDPAPARDVPWKGLRSDSVRADFLLEVYGRDIRAAMFAAALVFLVWEMLLSLPAAKDPPKLQKAAVLAGLLLFAAVPARSQQGDRFVWSQLKLGEDWDPYPGAAAEALQLLATVTSVLTQPEPRELTLKDPALFSSPLLVLAGRQEPPSLTDEELRNLRNHLSGGGTLWIEDVSGTTASSFDRWVRRLVPTVLPEADLAPLEPDHVIYKTFFLLRQAAGRVMVRATLEGAQWAGRTAVIYSRNDVLGAWAKDALGRPLLQCTPGGESQRHNARKLTINILMYSLTGSYKSDAVHQPFLLQKMRSGAQ